MKWTTATATLLSTGTLLLAGKALLVPERATPRGIYEDVRQRVSSDSYDVPLALRDLGRAIGSSGAGDDLELTTDLLRLRADIFARLEDYGAARADLERVIGAQDDPSPELELRSIELESLAGQVDSAWERLARLLEKEPGFAPGWHLAGQLERRLAEDTREQARQVARLVLVQSDAEIVGRTLVELAARDPNDRVRPKLAESLRGFFIPNFREELQQVLKLAERASEYQAQARESYARSFAGGIDEEAVREFLQLYRESGQSSLAADIGIASQALSELATSERVVEVILESLIELGQVPRARNVVTTWPWKERGASEQLCLNALQILFEDGDWKAMGPATEELRRRNSPRAISAAKFYKGLFFFATGNPRPATEHLTKYLNDEDRIEPVDGAIATTYVTLSRAWGDLGNEQKEFETLLRALTPPRGATEDTWTSRIDGEAYLRFVELSMRVRNTGYRRPEEHMTHALTMLPERTDELLPLWTTIGQKSLGSDGRDLDSLLRNMRTQRRNTPAFDVGPWAMHQVAIDHTRRPNYHAAIGVSRKMLNKYPGLLPSMDLLVDGLIHRGVRTQALDHVLDRIEKVGRHQVSDEFLDRIGEDAMSPDQVLRLMRLDAAGYGRRRVAEYLLSRGDAQRALSVLRPPQVASAKPAKSAADDAKDKTAAATTEEEGTSTEEASEGDPAGEEAVAAETGDTPPTAEVTEPEAAAEIEGEVEELATGETVAGAELDDPQAQETGAQETGAAQDTEPDDTANVETTDSQVAADEGQDAAPDDTEALADDGGDDSGSDRPTPSRELPEVRVLRGKALVALERYAEAVEELEPLISNRRVGPDALVALVDARLASNEPGEVESLVQSLVKRLRNTTPRPKAVALRVIDHLLDAARAELAAPLLRVLDSGAETRGGDVLARMVLQRSLTGDRDAALDALERAEAFLGDGSVELVRLLFAIEDFSWTQLPTLVARLRDARASLRPKEDAILALLEERLEAGVQMARTGLAENPDSGQWALIHAAAQTLAADDFELGPYFGPGATGEMALLMRGSEGRSRDPRQTLALLLAIESAHWTLWAEPRVEDLAGRGAGDLWPGFLAAEIHQSLGRVHRARTAFAKLTLTNEAFGPAWDGLERAVRATVDDDWAPAVLQVRARRLKALGDSATRSPIERALDEAAALFLASDIPGAAERIATELADKEGRVTRGRTFLARLYTSLGEHKLAVTEYELAIVGERPASDSALVAEYLRALMRGLQPTVKKKARLNPGVVAASLEELQTRFPRDPMIPLERARLGVSRETRNPSLAVGLAGTLLIEFRNANAGVPFEALRRGSARAWTEFLIDLAPEAAAHVIREDLQQTPGDIELWMLLAETLEAQEKIPEALDLRAALASMSSEAEVQLSYAWLLVETGGDRNLVNQLLLFAELAEDAADIRLAERLRFVRAVAQLRSERPSATNQIRTLGALWKNKKRVRGVKPLTLARSYATALLMRREAADIEAFVGLLDELGKRKDLDPYEADAIRGLRGMSIWLEPSDGLEVNLPEPPMTSSPKEGAAANPSESGQGGQAGGAKKGGKGKARNAPGAKKPQGQKPQGQKPEDETADDASSAPPPDDDSTPPVEAGAGAGAGDAAGDGDGR